jgi:fumarate reductase subunit C
MSAAAPRRPPYRRPQPRTWWLRERPYRRFAARELTSLAVLAFAGILLGFLFALSAGRGAYQGFLRWLEEPAVLALHAIILAALCYHALTWFRLTAHIQVVRVGGRELPRRLVQGGLLGAWLALSGGIAYVAFWLPR